MSRNCQFYVIYDEFDNNVADFMKSAISEIQRNIEYNSSSPSIVF